MKLAIGLIVKGCGYICNFVIFAMGFIIVYEIITRYFLARPTIWVVPLSQYLLGVICFLGASFCLQKKGHIRVDIFVNQLSYRWKKAAVLAGDLIAFLFSILLGWQGYLLWKEAFLFNITTGDIWDVPMWIPYLFFPLGVACLALQYAVEIIGEAFQLGKSQE